MKISEEMAVRLHRMMWSDMQKELGDNPNGEERENYKTRWISKHFPGAMVHHACFLCEFTQAPYSSSQKCKNCPIKWPNDICISEGAGANINYFSSPISEILALPARNEKLAAEHDETALVRSYYQYREGLLSKVSGRPASTSIDDHVKAIQEKAVEEYFAKTPGAKLATMDVDQAFKQYADEQKAPIFHALAEASGLSAGNESVKAHIYEIRRKEKHSGRKEANTEIFKSLSVFSGVSRDNWSVYDHAEAIMKKPSNEKELDEARKALSDAVSMLCLYKSTLSYESKLPSNAPVADHIEHIREYAFLDGKVHERERIMDKIQEILEK